MVGERRDVAGPLAQRRYSQRHHIQAEVQVLTERATLDFGRQIAVGGREDPHIHPHGRGTTEPVDLALLECAQQLGLQPDVHLADFVEQQRTAIGCLKFPHPSRDGARERTFLVAEQFRLQQIVGNRRTIQGNEWSARAAGTAVDVACQHLFARCRTPQ